MLLSMVLLLFILGILFRNIHDSCNAPFRCLGGEGLSRERGFILCMLLVCIVILICICFMPDLKEKFK